MVVGQIENCFSQKSTEQVQNSAKIVYGEHPKGGISRGDSVLLGRGGKDSGNLVGTVRKMLKGERSKAWVPAATEGNGGSSGPHYISGIPARRVLISQPDRSLNPWAVSDSHHAPFISTYIYEANLCQEVAMTTPNPKTSDPDIRCEDSPGTFPPKSTDIAKESSLDISPSQPKAFHLVKSFPGRIVQARFSRPALSNLCAFASPIAALEISQDLCFGCIYPSQRKCAN